MQIINRGILYLYRCFPVFLRSFCNVFLAALSLHSLYTFVSSSNINNLYCVFYHVRHLHHTILLVHFVLKCVTLQLTSPKLFYLISTRLVSNSHLPSFHAPVLSEQIVNFFIAIIFNVRHWSSMCPKFIKAQPHFLNSVHIHHYHFPMLEFSRTSLHYVIFGSDLAAIPVTAYFHDT